MAPVVHWPGVKPRRVDSFRFLVPGWVGPRSRSGPPRPLLQATGMRALVMACRASIASWHLLEPAPVKQPSSNWPGETPCLTKASGHLAQTAQASQPLRCQHSNIQRFCCGNTGKPCALHVVSPKSTISLQELTCDFDRFFRVSPKLVPTPCSEASGGRMPHRETAGSWTIEV